MGLAREDDRTPDTTPQNTLITMVSSVGKKTRTAELLSTHTHCNDSIKIRQKDKCFKIEKEKYTLTTVSVTIISDEL